MFADAGVLDLMLGKELQSHDLEIKVLRLPNHGRSLRIVHRPTGLLVDESEPVRSRSGR